MTCVAVQMREARAAHSIRSRVLTRTRPALTHAHCHSQITPFWLTYCSYVKRICVHIFIYAKRLDISNGATNEMEHTERSRVYISTRMRPRTNFGHLGRVPWGLDLGLSPDSYPPASESQDKLLMTRPVVPEIPHPTVLSFWCHVHLSVAMSVWTR